MSWFSKLCRNLGLMVHNIRHPERADQPPAQRKRLRETAEEEQRGRLTLRRTTIEEIEYRSDERRDDEDRTDSSR
jgi:hypothetical protein